MASVSVLEVDESAIAPEMFLQLVAGDVRCSQPALGAGFAARIRRRMQRSYVLRKVWGWGLPPVLA